MTEYLKYMDKFGLPRSGIIHIGANFAGEARFYDAYGKVPVAFFEPVPSVFELAQKSTSKFPRQRVFQACCSDRDGDEVTFSVSSNRGMSSSMYPLGRHGELAPGITYVDQFKIKTSRAETILKQHYALDDFNLAVIDTQGADLLALKGLGEFLDHLDAVYIEISDQPLYEGGAAFDDIYRYLNDKGFALAMLYLNVVDFGNAFFKRRVPSHMRALREGVSVGKPASMSSVYKDFGAHFGNDGNIPANPVQRKFFHTRREEQPWWKVDLGEIVPISRIFLFDWMGQLPRVDSLVVEVSNDDSNYRIIYDRKLEPVLCDAKGKPLNAFGLTTIKPDDTSARWVRLRLQDTNYLHMRQVVVERAKRPTIAAVAGASKNAA